MHTDNSIQSKSSEFYLCESVFIGGYIRIVLVLPGVRFITRRRWRRWATWRNRDPCNCAASRKLNWIVRGKQNRRSREEGP